MTGRVDDELCCLEQIIVCKLHIKKSFCECVLHPWPRYAVDSVATPDNRGIKDSSQPIANEIPDNGKEMRALCKGLEHNTNGLWQAQS